MNTNDIIRVIEQHSILQIAGYTMEARHRQLYNRMQQLTGMLEVLQRLNGMDCTLIEFIRSHRDKIVEELQAL